ncbi:DUF1257 domain-containing protein [bacterium]|nr:DUF1257 domain-containing protein [bacterium]
MSVVFVVAPMVVAGWPVMCGAIAAAAGALGYKALSHEHAGVVDTNSESDCRVEIPIESSQIVAESMARESQFTIANGDVTATFSRSANGRCTVHVSGQNKTDEQLQAIGQELVGKVTQQYAYNKVVTELKNQGFTVTDEEMTADQAIRIHVTKYV